MFDFFLSYRAMWYFVPLMSASLVILLKTSPSSLSDAVISIRFKLWRRKTVRKRKRQSLGSETPEVEEGTTQKFPLLRVLKVALNKTSCCAGLYTGGVLSGLKCHHWQIRSQPNPLLYGDFCGLITHNNRRINITLIVFLLMFTWRVWISLFLGYMQWLAKIVHKEINAATTYICSFFFFLLDGRGTVVGTFFDIDLQPKTETFWKSHKRKIVFF